MDDLVFTLPPRLRTRSAIAVVPMAVPGLLVGMLVHRLWVAALLAGAAMAWTALYCFGARFTAGPQGLTLRWTPLRTRRYGWHEIAGVELMLRQRGARAARLLRHQGGPVFVPMLISEDPGFDVRLAQLREVVARYTGIPQAPVDDVPPVEDAVEPRRPGRAAGLWQAVVAVLAGAVLLSAVGNLDRDRKELAAYRSALVCTSLTGQDGCRIAERLTVDHVRSTRDRTTVYLQMGDSLYPFSTGHEESALKAVKPADEVLGTWVTGVGGISISQGSRSYEDTESPVWTLSDDYAVIAVPVGACLFFAGLAVAARLRRARGGRRSWPWLLALPVVPLILMSVLQHSDTPTLSPPWAYWAAAVPVAALLMVVVHRLDSRQGR